MLRFRLLFHRTGESADIEGHVSGPFNSWAGWPSAGRTAQPSSREVLVELLWPETDLTAGRHNLSNALGALRHVLEPPSIQPGAVLMADRAAVRLNPAVVSTDVARFEALVRRCADAWALEHRALEIHLQTRYIGRAAQCLLFMTMLAQDQGRPALAARLPGAADRLRPADVLETDVQKLTASLLALLGREALERETAAGRALSNEELLAFPPCRIEDRDGPRNTRKDAEKRST